MQAQNPAGEDARDLLRPLVRRHIRRVRRVGAQRHRALLPEMLTRPWSVEVLGIGRPRHYAAGYWIPTRWRLEVAREAAESNPGVNRMRRALGPRFLGPRAGPRQSDPIVLGETPVVPPRRGQSAAP